MGLGLLILSCGTNAGWHIVKTLREKFSGHFRIIGTDTNNEQLVPCARMLDAFYKVPHSMEMNFINIIESILKKERPAYILPSFDFDQQLFYNGSEILGRYGVSSLSTPKETLKMYEDKAQMYEAMIAGDLPVPMCYTRETIVDDSCYFIKPIHGYGSTSASMINGEKIQSLASLENYVIQEVCLQPEITMECFTYQGRFSSICRERLQTKAGVCTKARVFKSPKLEAIGKRFAELFKTPMFFNLQFMQTKTGRPVITDVNLRLAGGMGLSCAAGWDEVSAIAKVMLAHPINDVMATLPEFVPEQYVVRVYDDVQTKVETKKVAFDLDGTLLDSRLRHRVVLDDVLRTLNIVLDTSELVKSKRNGGNNVDYLVSHGISQEMAKVIQAMWIEHIEDDKYLDGDILYNESREVLLGYAGWHRILVTARRNKEGLFRTLRRLGLDQLFDEVYVVIPDCNVARRKAEVLAREKVLIFHGDTRSDFLASQAADVRFKFHENGFHSSRYCTQGVTS